MENGAGNNWQSTAKFSLSQDPNCTVTCLKFDPYEELLWCGTSTGLVSSFYPGSDGFERLSAFSVSKVLPVKQIDICEHEIFSLTANKLTTHTRQGIAISSYSSNTFVGLECMYRVPDTPTYLIGGLNSTLIIYNCETLTEIRSPEISEDAVTIIRSGPKNIFTADNSGNVSMRCPITFETLWKISAHGDKVLDFDIKGNRLITIGKSFRGPSSHGDPFVNVYDLRSMKALCPISFTFSPMFARFIPSYCDQFMVVGKNGTVYIMDVNSDNKQMMMIDVNTVSAVDFSSNMEYLAFGEDFSSVSVHTKEDSPTINAHSYETILPDRYTAPAVSFGLDDVNTPLACIPMPFPEDEDLLSDWPSELTQPMYRRKKPLPVGKEVKTIHFVQRTPNPFAKTKLTHFNVCPYILDDDELKQPMHLIIETGATVVPRFYHRISTKANRKVEDPLHILEFNRTNHIPIENTSNSFLVNPIAQLIYHVQAARNVLFSHLCLDETCISCQLRFLFSMLSTMSSEDESQTTGKTCASASGRNLERCFVCNGVPDFAGHVLKSSHNALRAIFDSLNKDAKVILETSQLTPKETESFFTSIKSENSCTKCGKSVDEEVKEGCLTFNYTEKQVKCDTSFVSLIERCLNTWETTDTICKDCQIANIRTRKAKSLAPVLFIDTNSSHPSYYEFWQNQLSNKETRPEYKVPETTLNERFRSDKKKCRFGEGCRNKKNCKFSHGRTDFDMECATYLEEVGTIWSHYVPTKFYAEINDGALRVEDASQSGSTPVRTSSEGVEYELVGLVAAVGKGETAGEWTHSVTLLKDTINQQQNVPHRGFMNNRDKLNWVVINEILVTKVHENEALHMDSRWKLPLMLAYVRSDLVNDLMNGPQKVAPIPESMFYTDFNLTGDEEVANHRTKRLPEAGEIVGIDAEFIKLKPHYENEEGQDENSQDDVWFGVGRVSCLDFLDEGIIFDDYVVTAPRDLVSDYITKYSGITEEDLDPKRSAKFLTTLKKVYIKISFLLERGVVFVGHALTNDFSVLNIHVPKSQRIDTALLFRETTSQRLLSLKYLVNELLGKRIQEDCHDSVEDARYALRLYQAYQKLQKDGELEKMVRELHRLGPSPMKSVSPVHTNN